MNSPDEELQRTLASTSLKGAPANLKGFGWSFDEKHLTTVLGVLMKIENRTEVFGKAPGV